MSAPGPAAIAAATLLLHTEEELIFAGETARETAALNCADGTAAQTVEIQGNRGRLDGVLGLASVADRIGDFPEN